MKTKIIPFQNGDQEGLLSAVQDLLEDERTGRVETCVLIWTEKLQDAPGSIIKNYWFARKTCLTAYGLLCRMRRVIDRFMENE